MKLILKTLLILMILISGLISCHKPYQPNYNTHTSHNDLVKARKRMVEKQAQKEINRANRQRRRARKSHKVKKLQRKESKYAKKLIK
jgi:hypothetical protein